MILTESFVSSYLTKRDINLYLRGNSEWFLSQLDTWNIHNYPVCHKTHQSIFCFDCRLSSNKQDKLKLLSFLDELTKTTHSFQGESLPKLLLLLNSDYLSQSTQIKLKLWIETRHKQVRFIFHTNSRLLTSLSNRCLLLQLPKTSSTSTDMIESLFYKKWIRILKEPLSSTTLSKLRELCYMYHLQTNDSTLFQRYIIDQIGSNLYLPNTLKCLVLHDICYLNYLYQSSYRKSLYLETIFYSIFKHLQHYKTNL